MPDISRILTRSREGDPTALEELLPVVYAELRGLAAAHMRKERGAHSMQPTDLVHAAYLKLLDGVDAGWSDRAHFFAIAARAMREILIDHARRRSADKRTNPAQQRITLSEATAKPGDMLDLLALDEALAELAALDERKARILELRFFGGLKNPEIAETLGVSLNTVEKDWYAARAWLRAKLAN